MLEHLEALRNAINGHHGLYLTEILIDLELADEAGGPPVRWAEDVETKFLMSIDRWEAQSILIATS